jgi:DNA repair photolyase
VNQVSEILSILKKKDVRIDISTKTILKLSSVLSKLEETREELDKELKEKR